jgi:ribonuclease-3
MKKTLGYYPKNIALYKLAFTHRSATQNLRSVCYNNERLEFLGDSIIGAIVSDYLYEKFPNSREGFLTQIRSKIVGRAALDNLARELKLEKLLVTKLHRQRPKNISGNALEALVGAMYLDVGYKCTFDIFLNKLLFPHVNVDELVIVEVDYKSRLIEMVQKKGGKINFNTTAEEKRKGRAVCFVSHVDINGQECEAGKGLSKKEAEQRAAETTYNALLSSE